MATRQGVAVDACGDKADSSDGSLLSSFSPFFTGRRWPEGSDEGLMRKASTNETNRARSLRRSETDAEKILWEELRGRRLNGHKFVRQHPIGQFFVDFACREKMLVVELDGGQHLDSAYDVKRDEFLNSQGWNVLRFWNADVFLEMPSVLETILAALEGRLGSGFTATDLSWKPAVRSPSSDPSGHLLPVKNGEKEKRG